MAGAWLGALALAAAVLQLAQAVPVPSTSATSSTSSTSSTSATSKRVQEAREQSRLAQVQLDQAELRLQQARDALIKQLIVDVAHDQGIRGAVQAVRVEQQLEDEILKAARAARGHPQELQRLDQYVRRDKRALGLITSLLGGSGPVNRGPTYSAYIGGGANAFNNNGGGGGGGILSSLLSSSGGFGAITGISGGGGGGDPADELENGTPPGSDSGSILSLITPVLGSSSGSLNGGGGGDSEGGSGGAGSDSGSILSLVTPLLGTSSGNGYDDAPSTSDSANEAGGAGGSNSGAILNLVGPLLSSLLPLLSSSSGSSSGGVRSVSCAATRLT
ncbi:homeotic protein female sterile-like [Thrips palmi]|uniref:Homeotic protein female sterile-like n=1 Tax=Thrips palmi TaxID=161013 RepID=A0A6P8YTB0_THRPL|nr:homeotic protein female sterile-like [Thrips palmi]